MKNKLLIYSSFLFSTFSFSQNVAINTDGALPNASAMLDVVSTNKGFLMPRVALTSTTDAVTVPAPANWLMVFNTATVADVTPGMYYWNGAMWVKMLGGGDAWRTLGNAGTSAVNNFIGTTDAVDFVIRTNNTEKVRVQSGGNVGIGATPVASAKLDVNATDKGLMIPNVALTSRILAGPITLPATSLLVYNNNTAGAAPNNVVPGYYYNAGTGAAPNWTRFASGNGDAWITTGNVGTSAATNFLGTTDAVDLVFRTNNTEKMRVLSAGNVGIGLAAPVHRLHVDAGNATITKTKFTNGTTTGQTLTDGFEIGLTATTLAEINQLENNSIDFRTVNVQRARAWNDGSWFFFNGPTNDDLMYVSNSLTTRNFGALYTEVDNSTNGNGFGSANLNYADMSIYFSSSTYSFAKAGFYQPVAATNRAGGVIGSYMIGVTGHATGSLGYRAQGGTYYGVYGYGIAPQTGIAGGYSYEGNLNYSVGVAGYGGLVGSWSRGHVLGNINYGEMTSSLNIGNEISTGKNIELVQTEDKKIAVYTTSSIENQIYKSGISKLENGKAIVVLDDKLMQLIDKKSSPIITVTAMGKSGVLYIDKIEGNTFTVLENGEMNSNVSFNWILIADRVDGQDYYVAPEMLESSFDKNVIQFMSNEMDKTIDTKAMWYDGKKLRFDPKPEELEIKNVTKYEAKTRKKLNLDSDTKVIDNIKK
jgi:hypothetical protein